MQYYSYEAYTGDVDGLFISLYYDSYNQSYSYEIYNSTLGTFYEFYEPYEYSYKLSDYT
jgi:hypothetical protein